MKQKGVLKITPTFVWKLQRRSNALILAESKIKLALA